MESMDIDTGRSQEQCPSIPRPTVPSVCPCVGTAALAELYDALLPFVTEQAKISLGSLYENYLPPADADIFGLLKYVQNKWLSIFSDSPLEHHKSTIERLREAAYAQRRALNPMAKDKAKEVAKDAQSVLLAMRKPGAASKVAQLLEESENVDVTPARRRRPAQTRTGAASAAQPLSSSLAPAQGSLTLPTPLETPSDDISTQGGLPFRNLSGPKAPITLDGSNIAWRHGLSQRVCLCLTLMHFSVCFLCATSADVAE